jgi:hypothetical protein
VGDALSKVLSVKERIKGGVNETDQQRQRRAEAAQARNSGLVCRSKKSVLKNCRAHVQAAARAAQLEEAAALVVIATESPQVPAAVIDMLHNSAPFTPDATAR